MAFRVGDCLLQQLLDEKGMEQAELARKLNVTRPQINKYVRNKQGMTLQTAYNIAQILQCHVEDLYEWVEVGKNE